VNKINILIKALHLLYMISISLGANIGAAVTCRRKD